jgi:site-specific DNA recombinase
MSEVKMQRAAIYARYSSDLQNERSVDDQIALCRSYCDRNGYAVVEVFSDKAMSGASLLGRRGIADLVDFARSGSCDVVVCESLDRISRDIGDLNNIYKELDHVGIGLLEVHDGKADHIKIGLRGLIGSIFLKDLAHKVRRGAAGKIRSGQRAGSIPYGYRPVLGKPGHSVIYEPEAETVRRIFRSYTEGKTLREIAGELNADGIPTAQGGVWRASTLGGGRKRGDGLLANEIYHGVLVWNRVGKRKDPRTGKRVSRPNPESEWQKVDTPLLRIIDEDTWQAALAVREERRRGTPQSHRRAKRLLSGLIKCGTCGSGMSANGHFRGRPRAQCSNYTESRSCSNGTKIPLDTLEDAVLDALRAELKNPALLVEFAHEYHAERRRLAVSLATNRSTNERKLGEAQRSLTRMIDGVADGSLPAATVGRKIAELGAEVARLEGELAARPDDAEVLTLHPASLKRYLTLLEDLATSLTGGTDPETTTLIRALIDRIVVTPYVKGLPLSFEIEGKLAPLLGIPSGGGIIGAQKRTRTSTPCSAST